MIKGLFFIDEVIDISQKNKRIYALKEIQEQSPHLETWLRSTAWTNLIWALCRKSQKGLFLLLPASCIEAITNMKIGERITMDLVRQRLEPHLVQGSRLFDMTDYQEAKAWAGDGLLIRVCIILNPLQTEQDSVQLAQTQIRIFPTCRTCSKELKSHLVCQGCNVVCYCNTECRQLEKGHQYVCAMMKQAVDDLEAHHRKVTPPSGQRGK